MTRIASFSQQQSLVSNLLRNQQELFAAQQQVNTGKKAEDYKGYAGQTSAMISARSLKARNESYKTAAQGVEQSLQTNDLQLTSVVDTTRSLRQAVLSALGENTATGLAEAVNQAFLTTASVANTQVGGNYTFGGSRTDQKPVTVTSLAELAALPTADDAFNNDDFIARAQVSEGTKMDYGLTADQVALPIFSVLSAFEQFNQGPDGDMGQGQLSTDQRDFLQGMLDGLDDVTQIVQSVQVGNGLSMSRLDEIMKQQQAQTTYLETFIADIEDVDIASAITRLQSEQAAIEASYRVIGNLSALSLNNFL